MRFVRAGLVAAAALFGGVLSGCKPDAALQKGEVIGKGSKEPSQTAPAPVAAAPAGSGTISGAVSLSGKVPAKVLIDTTMDPACGISSPTPVYSEQYVVANGKLANVFVYVKTGPAAALQAGPISTRAVVLDQKGCQYTPHVIALMAGGSVEFRNSDLTMHNIHTVSDGDGNQAVDVSQGPKGAPVTKQFQKAERMLPVRCNNHPWMNAFINISQTPYFAVTDASGRFTLSGLPAGEYTLGAVHEKLGEQELKVTVPDNGAVKADFSFAAAK